MTKRQVEFSWATSLVEWFNTHKRVMPWRDKPTPYNVWISEMMLQQTQVKTVLPYFERFMKQFPTVYILANASQQDVLKAWEGLGYYTRARNLHKAAQMVVTKLAGHIPDSFAKLQELPGLGPYASAAIASIAYGEPVPAVDGNFLRVFSRFWGIEQSINSQKVRKYVFDNLQTIISRVDPSAFNQGVMEVGALICKPKTPLCVHCPLMQNCVAFNKQLTDKLPLKEKVAKVPHIQVGIAVISIGDTILITKRPEGKMLAGLWEFPGGKQLAGESIEETILRVLKKELGITIIFGEKLGVYRHRYSHFSLQVHAYFATLKPLQDIQSSTFEWVRLEDFEKYPFPEVDRKIIRDLKK